MKRWSQSENYTQLWIFYTIQLYCILKRNYGHKILFLKIFKGYKRNTIMPLDWNNESWEVRSLSGGNFPMELKILCPQESFVDFIHKAGNLTLIFFFFKFKLSIDYLFGGRNSKKYVCYEERRYFIHIQTILTHLYDRWHTIIWQWILLTAHDG